MKITNLKLKINPFNSFITVVIACFIFFVFLNLNWGTPFYFHPDERNIASAVSQLKLPTNLNPHFFAYGSFPIYIVYFLGVLTNLLSTHSVNFTVSFEQAIIIGRFLSALLTSLLVFLTYRFTKGLAGQTAAKLSAIFSATSVAYLQFSHFGTFEIWISFFALLMAYFFYQFTKTKKLIYFILGSATFGFLTALKLSSIILIAVPIYIVAIEAIKEKKIANKIKTGLRLLPYLAYFSFVLYFISAPFNLLDQKAFLSTMQYEGGIAMGSIPVFYTGSFYNTFPILFQYQKLLPFLINPWLTFISIPAILYSSYVFLKKRNISLNLILLSFLALFLSQSFLFAKWTRYIVPSLPFLYILIAVFLVKLKGRIPGTLFRIILTLIVGVNIVYAASFIKTVRLSPDTRLQALDFAKKNISPTTKIASEVYDLGIVPFNNDYRYISLFNFYDLDNNANLQFEFPSALKTTDYIILPSQRIHKSRTTNQRAFPQGYKFYSQLFSGKLGFKKIYETPCNIFCKITYLGDPIFNVEETSNVFDRPTVFVFKKIK